MLYLGQGIIPPAYTIVDNNNVNFDTSENYVMYDFDHFSFGNYDIECATGYEPTGNEEPSITCNLESEPLSFEFSGCTEIKTCHINYKEASENGYNIQIQNGGNIDAGPPIKMTKEEFGNNFNVECNSSDGWTGEDLGQLDKSTGG